MLNQFTIIKRDGSKESFDSQKISQVLIAAGLEQDKADVVTTKVTQKMTEQNKPEFTSLEVRDLIIKELDQIDSYIAGLYRWYQKTKDSSISV